MYGPSSLTDTGELKYLHFSHLTRSNLKLQMCTKLRKHVPQVDVYVRMHKGTYIQMYNEIIHIKYRIHCVVHQYLQVLYSIQKENAYIYVRTYVCMNDCHSN